MRGPQIIEKIVDRPLSISQAGPESKTGEPVLPLRLRRGLREALDAGRGRLRMDPQELADRLGAAIDLEVERIERIRERRQRRRQMSALLGQAAIYVAPDGRGQKSTAAQQLTIVAKSPKPDQGETL